MGDIPVGPRQFQRVGGPQELALFEARMREYLPDALAMFACWEDSRGNPGEVTLEPLPESIQVGF